MLLEGIFCENVCIVCNISLLHNFPSHLALQFNAICITTMYIFTTINHLWWYFKGHVRVGNIPYVLHKFSFY